jgi:phosphohistidine phosphatase SixA
MSIRSLTVNVLDQDYRSGVDESDARGRHGRATLSRMSAERLKETSGRIRVHLLRHAHAGDPLEWEGDDALRPLTRKGRKQCDQLGHFLDAHGIRPDVIVASPKIRALQTAELVAGTLGMTVRADARLAEDFGRRELADLIAESGAREPMFVGHDPDISSLLAYLVDAAGIPMKKAALATVDLEVGSGDGNGILRWLIPPDLLSTD